MKKWEYYQADKKTIWRKFGMKVKDIKPPQSLFEIAINRMGKMGWELVAVDNGKYYFKRELKKK
jgi:hypothetical protein